MSFWAMSFWAMNVCELTFRATSVREQGTVPATERVTG